ncbi:hypothetical protein Sjap_022426 [Stephania japonica]|uniref:Uncharacterized protein n=1 Tax=Stephania japonica TaxID=461633 RepID=A0AAP0HST4_9MAGN
MRLQIQTLQEGKLGIGLNSISFMSTSLLQLVQFSLKAMFPGLTILQFIFSPSTVNKTTSRPLTPGVPINQFLSYAIRYLRIPAIRIGYSSQQTYYEQGQGDTYRLPLESCQVTKGYVKLFQRTLRIVYEFGPRPTSVDIISTKYNNNERQDS